MSTGAMQGRPAGGLAQLLRVVRRVPFTTTVLLLMLGVGTVTGALWRPLDQSIWWERLAYGLPALAEGRWWTPLTGALAATIPVQYLPVGLGFALMVGFAEWRLSTRTAALVTVLGQAVGVLGAAAFLALAGRDGWPWAQGLGTDLDVGFSAGAICVLTVSAYSLRAPWRGRLLFAVIAYAMLNLLFVGVLWDVEHAIAVVLGLLIGRLVVGPRGPRTPWRMTRREWRLFAAGTVLLVALSQVMALLYPTTGPLGEDAFSGDHRLAVVVLVVVQLLVAAGLARGSRLAWQVATAVVVLGVGVAAVHGPPARLVLGLLSYGLVSAVLWRGRHAFSAAAAPLAVAGVLRGAVLMLALLALYAALGFVALRFRPEPTPRLAVEEFLNRLAFGSTGRFRGATRAAEAFLASLSVAWLVALVASLTIVLLRTRRPRASLDRRTALELLREHGGGDLSWMTTWPQNAHLVTSDGRGSVAYRVEQGVAVALGDPLGAPEAREQSLRDFARHCEHEGLIPCAFSATAALLPAAERIGWRWAQVAEDTVLDLPGLEFRGRAWQDVRTALNRAERDGIEVRLGRLADEPFTVVEQVRGISEQWVADRGLPELGFTLGGVEEALDPDVRVALAVDRSGLVHGVTSWLPVYAAGGQVTGWTLDLMRRRPDGFRPVIELLVARSCRLLREQGARTVSLSGAPLARSDPARANGAVDDLLDRLGALLEPYYGFRSLHAFKAKFSPRYQPLFLCYSDEAALPRIGLALARAYLPDLAVRDVAALVRSGGRG